MNLAGPRGLTDGGSQYQAVQQVPGPEQASRRVHGEAPAALCHLLHKVLLLPCQHKGCAGKESRYCFHVLLPTSPQTPHLLSRDLWGLG